jgi:hypothetical protein
MTFNRAMGWGLLLAFLTTVAILVVGFIAGAGFRIPGVMELSSSSSGGKPSTEFTFNPLAPIVLALVFGLLIWSLSHARSSRED